MNYEDQEFKEEKVNFNTWKKILKTVLKSKNNVVLLFVFVIALAILESLTPLLNRYAIDTFFKAKQFGTFVPFVIINVLVAIGFGFTIWGFIYQAGRIEVSVNYELRKQSFETLQRLSFSYFDKTPQGWVMARMTSDSRRLANIISWGLVDFLWSAVVMFVILIVMYVMNWKLALIVTAAIPFMAIIAIYFRKKILVGYRESRKINSQVTASYNESFMGAKTTKSLAIEAENSFEFAEKNT